MHKPATSQGSHPLLFDDADDWDDGAEEDEDELVYCFHVKVVVDAVSVALTTDLVPVAAAPGVTSSPTAVISFDQLFLSGSLTPPLPPADKGCKGVAGSRAIIRPSPSTGTLLDGCDVLASPGVEHHRARLEASLSGLSLSISHQALFRHWAQGPPGTILSSGAVCRQGDMVLRKADVRVSADVHSYGPWLPSDLTVSGHVSTLGLDVGAPHVTTALTMARTGRTCLAELAAATSSGSHSHVPSAADAWADERGLPLAGPEVLELAVSAQETGRVCGPRAGSSSARLHGPLLFSLTRFRRALGHTGRAAVGEVVMSDAATWDPHTNLWWTSLSWKTSLRHSVRPGAPPPPFRHPPPIHHHHSYPCFRARPVHMAYMRG